MPDQAAQQVAKQGPSKFDTAMKAQGPQGVDKAQGVQQAQQAQQVDRTKQIDQTQKLDKVGLGKADQQRTSTGKMDPVTQKSEVSKSTSMLSGMMANMEKGQVAIDKLISGGINGKNMSNGEMLALQAGMYKYTQELELTGKVVEKATSGLKDTLKTQV